MTKESHGPERERQPESDGLRERFFQRPVKKKILERDVGSPSHGLDFGRGGNVPHDFQNFRIRNVTNPLDVYSYSGNSAGERHASEATRMGDRQAPFRIRQRRRPGKTERRNQTDAGGEIGKGAEGENPSEQEGFGSGGIPKGRESNSVISFQPLSSVSGFVFGNALREQDEYFDRSLSRHVPFGKNGNLRRL